MMMMIDLHVTSVLRLYCDADSDLPLMIRLEVNNQLVSKPIQNVIATIFGEKDSDHSILIGASRNSFSTGLSGGIPGSDILIKVSSAISKLFHGRKRPWIPCRTIRFISWGGADFGHLGLTEFLEKYHNIWRNKVVAYIDLDNPLIQAKSGGDEANGQITITSSASVEVLAEMIVDQLHEKDDSLPKPVWQSVTKKSAVVGHNLVDADLAKILRKFLPMAYIRVMETTTETNSEPSEAEMSNAVERVTALLALTLADSGVLQFQVHRTANEVNTDVNRLISSFNAVLPNIMTDALRNQSKHLKKAATDLEEYIRRHLQYGQLEDIRMVNSILLQMDSEMTAILAHAADIQTRYQLNHDQHVVANDQCSESSDAEIQFLMDVSELVSRILAATKVTDLAG